MSPNARGVPWLNVEDAAKHLGLSTRAFYHFLADERARRPQRLKVHRLNGRLRFRQTDLDSCVEAEPMAAPLRLVGGRAR